MNLRSQARYRRWAYGFAPYVYSQEIYKDTAIYYTDMETGEPRGSRRAGAGGAAAAVTAAVVGGTLVDESVAAGDVRVRR